MTESVEDKEWRGLIERLHEEPELPGGAATIFEDPAARSRVGLLITKAVLGDELFQLYRLYCGNAMPPV
jgi:hypothetical protein